MKKLLLLDVESTGLDPAKDHLAEVGLVQWSVEHHCTLASASWLVRAPSNEAEKINRIPAAALVDAAEPDRVRELVRRWAEPCDAVMAHNADFDRQWVPDLGKPWIDSAWDLELPVACSDRKLTDIMLAHGLAVLDAHRALTDCQMMARLLERCVELCWDVDNMLAKALRPKVRVVAINHGFDAAKNQLYKTAGFRWSPESKEWWRLLPEEDAAALPFKVRVAR